MPAYILTGTPGAGKTAILRLLEISGYAVVEEAATDVIALANALGHEEPWRDHAFIDKVIALQRQRQDSVRAGRSGIVFCDRSPVCTLALSRHLGFTSSSPLAREVDRILADGTYENTVFSSGTRASSRPPRPGGSAWRTRSPSSGCMNRHTASSGSSSSTCPRVR